jgi:hypothetical protein
MHERSLHHVYLPCVNKTPSAEADKQQVHLNNEYSRVITVEQNVTMSQTDA